MYFKELNELKNKVIFKIEDEEIEVKTTIGYGEKRFLDGITGPIRRKAILEVKNKTKNLKDGEIIEYSLEIEEEWTKATLRRDKELLRCCTSKEDFKKLWEDNKYEKVTAEIIAFLLKTSGFMISRG